MLLISRLINRSGLRTFHSKVFSSDLSVPVFFLNFFFTRFSIVYFLFRPVKHVLGKYIFALRLLQGWGKPFFLNSIMHFGTFKYLPYFCFFLKFFFSGELNHIWTRNEIHKYASLSAWLCPWNKKVIKNILNC